MERAIMDRIQMLKALGLWAGRRLAKLPLWSCCKSGSRDAKGTSASCCSVSGCRALRSGDRRSSRAGLPFG